jgi:hypothetical protein
MPQDATFGLPLDTPVGRHPEYAQERHLSGIRNMVRATPDGPRVLSDQFS